MTEPPSEYPVNILAAYLETPHHLKPVTFDRDHMEALVAGAYLAGMHDGAKNAISAYQQALLN